MKTAPDGRLEVEYVKVSPSGSVAAMLKLRGDVSFTVLLPIGLRTGARSALYTIIVIFSDAVKIPSETWKCMLGYEPA